MEPTKPAGFQSRGSIGIPNEMKADLEAQRAKAHAAKTPQAPPQAAAMMSSEVPTDGAEQAAASEAAPEKTEEQKSAEQRMKLKADIQERWGMEITADDLKDYIFKGRIAKELNLIEGSIKATFQTMTPEESQQVDERMAAFRDKSKNTERGIMNEETLITLGMCWTHAAGRPIGKDAADREKKIRKMGNHMIDLASGAWADLNLLIKIALTERPLVKK